MMGHLKQIAASFLASDGTGENMSEELDTYKQFVDLVKQECKDADESKIASQFKKYETEFLIPPEDALRSVVRVFAAPGTEPTLSSSEKRRVSEKKVDRFSDLEGDDKNITIEVYVVSYNPKIQNIRGEDRQIGFGYIEDNPWKESSQRERWNYTDWGNIGQKLAPGSIVRLEGVSVNEWKGSKSINVNQTTRVTTLQEGGPSVSVSVDEPLSIKEASERVGLVSVIARLESCKDDIIVSKDASKQYNVVRGVLVDESGSIPFTSWIPFSQDPGTLLKINGASIRKYRQTPQMSFDDSTKIELYRDGKFPDLESLSHHSRSQISSLLDGMSGVNIVVQVQSWQSREISNSDGGTRIIYSGDVLDPTGRSRLTCWSEFNPEIGSFLELSDASVRSWNGSPDLSINSAENAMALDEAPWESIDPEDHWVFSDLSTLSSSGSRVGIETTSHIVSVRDDCGLIERCPECRRKMFEGSCNVHGPQRGVEDLRLRFVVDNGVDSTSVIMNRESSESFLQSEMSEVAIQISARGKEEFVSDLRKRLLGKRVTIRGRSMVDDRGMIIMADSMEEKAIEVNDLISTVSEKWGVKI